MTHTPLPQNPYIAGNPVGGSQAFVGRADLLRAALRVLKMITLRSNRSVRAS